MNNLGSDFDNTGSVMSPEALADMRKKQGKCVKCGQQCFKKKVFKLIPLTIAGLVDNGKCLKCGPSAGVGGGGSTNPNLSSSISMSRTGFSPSASMLSRGSGGPTFNTGTSASSFGSSAGGSSIYNSSMPPNFGSSGRSNASEPSPITSTKVGSLNRVASLPAPTLPKSGSQGSIETKKKKKKSRDAPIMASVAMDAPVMAEPVPAPAMVAMPEPEPYDDLGDFERYDEPVKGNFGDDAPDLGSDDANYGYDDRPDDYYDGGNEGDYEDPPFLEETDIPPHRGDETAQIVETSATGKSVGSRSTSELEGLVNRLKGAQGVQNIEAALEELALIRLSSNDMKKLVDIGAPKAISDTISSNKGSKSILNWGFSAIWNISGTKISQIAFVKAKVLDTVISTMERNKSDASFQENALAALSNLAAAKENLPEMIVRKGVVERIIDVLNTHSSLPSVLLRACNVITNLASHNSPLKAKIIEKGAGGSIIIVMVMNPDHVKLLETAIRAIRNLTTHEKSSQAEFANNGGVDSVISAMQKHRDVAQIQREGSWSLANLATTIDNREVIGDCGGIDVVVRCLFVHPEDADAVEKSLRALYNLSLDPHNAGIIMEIGGVSAIVQTMQGHTESAAVQEMGCANLASLADRSFDNKLTIVDEEALDAIVMSMVLNSEDAEVQKQACRALNMLCVPDNFQQMLAANIVELVTAAGEKFPEECLESYTSIVSSIDPYE